MNDKNDKASSKPIPPGKQGYLLINCFAEGKCYYYGKAAKYLKISEKNPKMLCDDYEGSHFTRAHLPTSMNSPTWVS